MGRNKRRGTREGTVVTAHRGAGWGAQLELEERRGGQSSRLRLEVPGTFSSEAAAVLAAQGVLNEWRVGGITLRDLVLRELAAVYRRLRERHATMEPVSVPTTSVAWDRAIGLWELAGWVDAAEAARYREHARWAFDAAAATVKRHRLLDAEPDSAK
jgi:hypothetical protein